MHVNLKQTAANSRKLLSSLDIPSQDMIWLLPTLDKMTVWLGFTFELEDDERAGCLYVQIKQGIFLTIFDFVALCHMCEDEATSIYDLMNDARPYRQHVSELWIGMKGVWSLLKMYGCGGATDVYVDSFDKVFAFKEYLFVDFMRIFYDAIQYADWRYYDPDSWIGCRNV